MFFSFVGKLDFNQSETAKRPFKNVFNSSKGSGFTINGTVEFKKGNRAWVQFFGWKPSDGKITKYDNDDNKIEFDWEDRFDEDIIKRVKYTNKNTISIGEDRHEYVANYDFAKYIEDNVEEFKGQMYALTGNLEKSWYNGKQYTTFKVTNMRKVEDDTKAKSNIKAEIYFTKDSIDTDDFKAEKKIYVNGYTYENVKDAGMKYVDQQIVIDCSKLDLDDDMTVKRLNINLFNIGLSYAKGKIENKLKSGKYYKNEFSLSYYNGAQNMGDASEITYDMLTDLQKMKVDSGMSKVEDFATSGTMYGNFITEYRLAGFPNKGKYADGMIKLEDNPEFDVDDFESNIYRPVAEDELPFGDNDDDEDEDEKPVKKEKVEKKTKKKAVDDDELPFDDSDDEDDDEKEDTVDSLFGDL